MSSLFFETIWISLLLSIVSVIDWGQVSIEFLKLIVQRKPHPEDRRLMKLYIALTTTNYTLLLQA